MLSEDELIRVIQRTVKSRGSVRFGIGDDAAVLKDGAVITTDAYADGVHFDLSYMSLRQVGERCACGAISDVVAMAAQPQAVLVALALPRVGGEQSAVSSSRGRKRMASGVRDLYRGIESVCAEMGCEVAGGDIIVADQLMLTLTVTGKTRSPRLRSGAKPGDHLYVTGHLGSAEVGRMLLAARASPKSQIPNPKQIPMSQCPRLTRRHLRPVPRLAVMRTLKSCIHGLIDTSDGLGTDARHLCEMSGVRVVLDDASLPVLPGVSSFCAAKGIDALDFVLGAGEDYELLLTSRQLLPDTVRGVKVTRIGSVEKGRGLYIRRDGRIQPVTVSGYDHLMVDNCMTSC